MILFLNILIFLIAITLLFWQASNIISIIYGCVYVQSDTLTAQKVISKFARKNTKFYELGSGNGVVLKIAARLGMKAEGFEISPFYYLLSKLNTIRYKNIKIHLSNVMDVELKKADIIYCYFTPKFLNHLKSKFEKDIKKNTILISKGFAIKYFKNPQKIKVENRSYYIYKF